MTISKEPNQLRFTAIFAVNRDARTLDTPPRDPILDSEYRQVKRWGCDRRIRFVDVQSR